MRRRRLTPITAAGAFALGLAVGCSSLEPLPPSKGCSTDAECTVEGEACFNGRCAVGNTPPRAIIGFDLQEQSATATTFRVQLRGCDRLVRTRENEPDVLRIVRSEVAQRFQFQVHASDEVDYQMLEPGDLLASQIDVTQSGRLGRTPDPLTRSVAQAIDPPGMDPGPEVASFVDWPRYHPLDPELPPPHVVWKTNPVAPTPAEGELPEIPLPPVYRMFRPPIVSSDPERACTSNADCCDGDCDTNLNYCARPDGTPIPEGSSQPGQCTLIGRNEFIQTYVYEPACARAVAGQVKTFDFAAPAAPDLPDLPGATVRLRYADVDPDAPLALFDSNDTPLADRPAQCITDDDCGYPELACDVASEQCVLRLAGRTANDSMAVSDDVGDFTARVYTYCEASPNEGNYQRAYTMSVSPPGPRPTVSYDVVATFGPGTIGTPSPYNLQRPLCVPEWGVQTELELPLTGAARSLVLDGGTPLRCCDTGCLPATAEDFDATVVGPTACDGRTTSGVAPAIRMETLFTLDPDQRAAWDTACMPTIEGVAGRLSLAADCSDTAAPCRFTSVATGDADAPREYSVRIESPVGSVLASRDLTIQIGADGLPLDPSAIELAPRVLLRGTVTVDEDTCASREDPSDCTSKGAIVLAERLAMPANADVAAETAATVPGPYLHQASTFFDPVAGTDGAYVLPLDPGGVYVVTALPAAGEDGGPAAYSVVDLRVDTDAELDLVLEAGRLVTLDIDTFDPSATVVPIDLGSEADVAHPGYADRSLDLSAIGECLTPASDPPQACRIRQLTAPNTSLPPSQVGIVRFRARSPSSDVERTCR